MRPPAEGYDPSRQAAHLRHVHALALQAWCRETSDDPLRWTPALPEYAQCAATALIVQDLFGGDLMRGRYERRGSFVTHCWNLLEGGVQVDLTRRQMRGARPLGATRVTRDKVLAQPRTAYRYAFLASRIAAVDRRRPRR